MYVYVYIYVYIYIYTCTTKRERRKGENKTGKRGTTLELPFLKGRGGKDYKDW